MEYPNDWQNVLSLNDVIIETSPHVGECGFRNPGKFYLWNPESWALESGMQLKETGIPLKIGILNPNK